MAQFTGEIKKINSRSGKGKKPPYRSWTAYSLIVAQENGEESGWLNAGFEAPPFNEGDYVTVTTETGAKGYEDIKEIVKAERPAQSKANTGASGEVSEEGIADKQTQIVLQHSQEMAIAEVALLIANNALPLSAATNKGGTAKRFEEIHAAINKLTVERFFDVVTGRLLETVADAGEVDLSADAQVPAANDDKATGTDD